MRTRSSLVAVLVLLLVAIAGCTDAPGDPERRDAEDPILVTSPDDYSYVNGTDPDRPHLHDYWFGARQLVVLEASIAEIGPGIGGGESIPMYGFRPDSGHVVPLGTSHVDVTLSWQDATGDMYSDPELWIKTAAENAPLLASDIENGETVRFESNNTANDLPHQLLSAWVFELRLSSPDPPAPFLRFKGEISIAVVAHRGLDIPLFPAHPDHWKGASSLPLFEAQHELSYAHDPTDGGCDGMSCQVVHVPDDGRIVPPDAADLVVVLDQTSPPGFRVGLAYHGAESRGFQRPAPTTDGETTRTYRIPVAGFGDGPYAQQSQWAFLVVIEEPAEDGAVYASYTLSATVERAA